ncbi:MAG TPA: FAD-dependent oxidoreductase [Mycobacteriales bacterium]|nr:FAD-dependent oxidoreductase [Mycobacteriales bacterium]
MVERTDVVIVGAGLAGLAAARVLERAGLSVIVLEAAEAPGGRVRTDRRDGLLLDHGFQLLNPAYPEVVAVVDLDALRLSSFAAGVVVRDGSVRSVLADPRREPREIAATVRGSGSLRAKLAVARWFAEAGALPPSRLRARADRALATELRARGLAGRGDALEGAVGAFLSGVLAEADLTSSARLATFLVRSFVRGAPGLPAAGMQALPEQLAAALRPGTVRLGTAARRLRGTAVDTDAGTIRGDALVVATDAVDAAGLLEGEHPAMRGLTTYYHLVDRAPDHARYLHVDARRDGPVVNVAAVSAVAPSYAPAGRTLLASTVLGAHGDEQEQAVRAHTAQIVGAGTGGWDYVATFAIPRALPAHPAGQALRRSVLVGEGRFVAGDHRDTPSIQGALVSGRRVAHAVLAHVGGPSGPSGR